MFPLLTEPPDVPDVVPPELGVLDGAGDAPGLLALSGLDGGRFVLGAYSFCLAAA